MADKLADQTGEGGMLESLREQAKSGIAEQIRLELDEAANNVDNLKNKLKELEPMGQILAGIGDIITSNINSALDQLVDGTISAKEAFKQMAISILKDIVKMINKLIVQYILMQLMNMILPGSGTAISASGNIMGQGSSGPGGDFTGKANFSPGAFDFGGGRYGGIMKPPAGYRAGGIADGSSSGYPVMLHGREAVVPLPHGDKIPVELRGGGTQQNNVGVTVNINNDGSSSTTTSADSQENQANALGNTIASVVRRELLNQKRAGGLLSPYGVQ
jgi:phage-related minor tail protein